MKCLLLAVALMILAIAQSVSASGTEQLGERSTSSVHSYGVWTGFSFNSPIGWKSGIALNREVFLLGMWYGRRVKQYPKFEVTYKVELLPVAIVTKVPKIQHIEEYYPDGHLRSRATVFIEGSSVYGAGVSPIGLGLNVGNHSRIRFLSSFSLGVFLFSKDVPVPYAGLVNFTFAFGGGVDFKVRERMFISVGYIYRHLSNADLSRNNPGLDANVFRMGISAVP